MTLPVADTKPPVRTLPPVIFAAEVIVDVTEISPSVKILPPVILPVADINPPVRKLPPVTLPATDKAELPVLAMATSALPKNCTVELPATGPILILVVELAAPKVPMSIVLMLVDAVTPLPIAMV